MCDSECDRPDAYSERVRKARKDHRCCACRETIRKGDRYFYTSGIWDGRPESYKHCIRCMEMLRWLEALADDPPAELAFMTPDEMQTRAP